MSIFQFYHVESKLNSTRRQKCMLCTRPTRSVGFLQCQLTETTVRGQTCLFTLTHYSDSEPTSPCSYSLIQRVQRRSSTYQFYSLWFDTTGRERTHDLPYSRRTYPNRNIHCTIACTECFIHPDQSILDYPLKVEVFHNKKCTRIFQKIITATI